MKTILSLVGMMISLTFLGQLPDYVSETGLVAWYDLAGGGEDWSDNGNDGVVDGAIPAEDHFGNELGALFFEASTISIETTENFALENFTVSAWFNTTSTATGYQTIFSHFSLGKANDYYGYWLGLLGENADLFLAASSWVDLTNSVALNDGEWHMMVGVFNYAYASIYVDGELANTVASGMSLAAAQTDIGNDFLGEAFYGTLDDIGIWNRPLSACEIALLYEASVNSTDVSVTQDGNNLEANLAGASYQWVDCSNYLPIEGAVAQDFTPSANGEYAVMIDVDGCVSTSDCYSVTGVGVEEINDLTISAFPVPSNEYVQLNLPVSATSIAVYDVLGQLVFIDNVQGPFHMLELSELGSRGSYVVHAIEANGKQLASVRIVYE